MINSAISRGLKVLREDVETAAKESLGHYRLKRHKTQLDEEC
jgi:hypothetical protein